MKNGGSKNHHAFDIIYIYSYYMQSAHCYTFKFPINAQRFAERLQNSLHRTTKNWQNSQRNVPTDALEKTRKKFSGHLIYHRNCRAFSVRLTSNRKKVGSPPQDSVPDTSNLSRLPKSWEIVLTAGSFAARDAKRIRRVSKVPFSYVTPFLVRTLQT